MRLVIVLAMMACGAAPRPVACRTRCGVEIGNFPYSAASGQSCEDFQLQEDTMLAEFTKINDPRFKNACNAMSGWYVTVEPTEWFTDPYYGTAPLAGITYCDRGTTRIGNSDIWDSAYAHEMAHAIQMCWVNPCSYTSLDEHHACWDTNGVISALLSIEAKTKPNGVH